VREALPDICDFLGVKQSKQTYQKFATIVAGHHRIADILSPLRVEYVGLDSLLSGRKAILSALNHGIVRSYGEPFRIAELRSIVETIFAQLHKVVALDATLLADVEECRRNIADGRAVSQELPTFFAIDVFLPFLSSAEAALDSFLNSASERFTTGIIRGDGAGSELQKKYPLHETGRKIQLFIPMRNVGPGLATNVRASITSNTDQLATDVKSIFIGNIRPGDFSIAFDAMVIAPTEKTDVLVEVEWGELGDVKIKSEIFEIVVAAQRADVDWTKLDRLRPYSTAVAEGANFVGRKEKVRQLASKLIHDPMEPFYITGQKRVGKTSLAKAAAEFASQVSEGNVVSEYILWGGIVHENPREAMRALGETIETFLMKHLPAELQPARASYEGSLSALLNLSTVVFEHVPQRRFVLIIDEFDEIPQELFLFGNLAETFFGNLRALTTSQNICLVLVGGENMPFIMARQGQKLNKLSRHDLNYYSRDAEWEDYKLLVRSPIQGHINWQDDAVNEIYNVTNGNPYFTKIICATALRAAVRERDADITATEVRRATESEVSTLDANSFMHLWQDGIFKPLADREPDVVRRMKSLVAIARCLRRGLPATLTNIAGTKQSSGLSEGELAAALDDFVRRSVLHEDGGAYRFNLPLFGYWLVDVGLNRLIADPLTQELARGIQAEEDAAHVRSEEIVELAKKWPTYRGKHIGTDEIRAWLQQVDGDRQQRLLFTILKHLRFYSETQIRERLRTAHGMLRPLLPEFVIRRQSDRRKDVLITYVDGEGKSGQYYAAQYAEENRVSVDCIRSPATIKETFSEHQQTGTRIAGIVIIDDIAGTGRSLGDNALRFITENRAALTNNGTIVLVVTVLATPAADLRIREALSSVEGVRADFRSCEILDDGAYAFVEGNGVWKTQEALERAKALCADLGARVKPQSPLGFDSQGLLVVFPTTTPNNSLPILHSFSRPNADKRWVPLFERMHN
jgi:ATPase domain predominantly from Archaea